MVPQHLAEPCNTSSHFDTRCRSVPYIWAVDIDSSVNASVEINDDIDSRDQDLRRNENDDYPPIN